MGNLPGHVIAGSFFTLYGAFWCANFIWYHLKSKAILISSGDGQSKKETLTHSASMLCLESKQDHDLSRRSWIPLPCTRFPVEPLLKILFSALYIIVEAFLSYDRENKHVTWMVYRVWGSDGHLNDSSKFQHVTISTGFMLSGAIDLLTMCIKLPHQTSMLFLSLAFTVEGFLFYMHNIGSEALNLEVHQLNTCVIAACIVFSVLRIFMATNLVVNLGLGSSILLQGTWLIQVGFLLFGSVLETDTENEVYHHRQAMFAVSCFVWHLIVVSLYSVVIWIIFSLAIKNQLFHRRSKTLMSRGLLSKLRLCPQDQNAEGEEKNKLLCQEEKGEVVTAESEL